jgi:hypothetical protein
MGVGSMAGSDGRFRDHDEGVRVRRLQRLVDVTLAVIAQSRITLEEAQDLVQGVRAHAHEDFPDKKETFELIYTPRFRRLIAEKFRMQ